MSREGREKKNQGGNLYVPPLFFFSRRGARPYSRVLLGGLFKNQQRAIVKKERERERIVSYIPFSSCYLNMDGEAGQYTQRGLGTRRAERRVLFQFPRSLTIEDALYYIDR